MAEIVEQNLSISTLVIDSMLDWLSEENVGTETEYRQVAGSQGFYDRLKQRTANLPQIEVATFIALDGTVLNFTRSYPPPPINLADRDYFQAQLSTHAPSVSLGNVVRNRGSGVWTFYLAKAVQGAAGETLGVAIVGLPVHHYSRLFARISGTSDEKAYLLREDGFLLATGGSTSPPLGAQVVSPYDLKVGLAPQSALVAALQHTAGDDLPVIASAKARLRAFPAYIVVVRTTGHDQNDWWEKFVLFVAAGGVATLLALLAGWRNYRLVEQTDRALRQESERRILSTIFGSPLTLAAVVDGRGGIFYRNAQFAAHLGPFIHDDVLVLGEEIEGAKVLAAILDGRDNSAEFTLRLPGKEGMPSFLRFKAARIDGLAGDGGAIALVGYDDTDRVEANAHIVQSSKLITLGEMATSMAHELNQPLNVIKMAGQSALFEIDETVSSGAAAGAGAVAPPHCLLFLESKLQRIIDQVDRAASIIDHMRIFGRVPRGMPPVIDVSTVCRAAQRLLVHQLREAQIRIETSFENQPMLVRCHPILLEQVLVNLILNARDALTGATSAAAEIRIAAARAGQDVVVVVSDNGPGIPPELRGRVFEPFFTTKTAENGTGLGLSVSYGIVRDSGGKLELLNECSGCAFRLSLPAVSQEAGETS